MSACALVRILSSALVAVLIGGCLNRPVEVHGAGASFPAPIYARWCALFHRANPEIVVHYRALGSGRGIEAITNREVDFGASDALLKEDEQRALPAPLLTIPTVLGPVVLAYNLPGLEAELILSGEVIAGIYLGEIMSWNDWRIRAINPGLALPEHRIQVAHRSDSSGTSYLFTDYLSAVSERWRRDVGRGKEVSWPTGDAWAGEGNDGVAHRILLAPGGIGYLELTYAQNAGLKYATLLNRDGHAVRPTLESVQQAESNTSGSAGTYLKASIVNAPGPRSYPIAGFTYLLVYRDLSAMEPRKAKALLAFLHWILNSGQAEAAKLHYTPLPEPLRLQTLAELGTVVVPAGHSLTR
jgi:phosphate transport system substrate-binding protein